MLQSLGDLMHAYFCLPRTSKDRGRPERRGNNKDGKMDRAH